MSYEVALDPLVPGQGEFARLGASRIRGLTKAVFERLSTFFVNPNSDPMIFKPELMPIKRVTFDYAFAGGTTVAANAALTVSIPLPAGNEGVAADVPHFTNWKNATDIEVTTFCLTVQSYYTGSVLKCTVFNAGTVTRDISAVVLQFTLLVPLQGS